MAIIYTYPKASVEGGELLLITDNDIHKSTRNLGVETFAKWIPTQIQLQDFKLYDKDFCNPLPAPLQDQDIIVYNAATDTWCPAVNPTPVIPTEVVNVAATLDSGLGIYVGVGTPPITAYSSTPIYKTIFNLTNPTTPYQINIDNAGIKSLKYADPISGAVLDIPASFIVPNNVYYMSYVGGDFILSTTAPPSSQTSVEYSNPNAVSILQDVGGVAANQGETWAPFPDPVTGVVRGWNLTEIMNRIFYPYQSPAFSSFAMQNQNTSLEVGQTLTGGLRNFTWGFTNTNVLDPSLDIYDYTTAPSVPLNTAQLPITPTASVDIGSDITKLTAGNHRWRASAFSDANDPSGSTQFFSMFFTVNWYYRWYWGSSTLSQLGPNDIASELNVEGISNGNINTTRNFTGDGSTTFWYLCYPDSWGDLQNWATGSNGVDTNSSPNPPYDQSQGNGDNFDRYMLVQSVPAFGSATTTYRVFRTGNEQGSSQNVIIKI